MLDFSWSHILIVLIVALVVVGPKDLPRLMRMLGRWMGQRARDGRPVPQELRRDARASELDELRAEINALRNARISENSILPPDAAKPSKQKSAPEPAEPPP